MEKKQLCWKCENTNRHKCKWFRTTKKHPSYCTIDEDGFIVKCEKFIKEKVKRYKIAYTNNYIAAYLGVGIRTFYRHKQKYIEEFYEKLKTIKE